MPRIPQDSYHALLREHSYSQPPSELTSLLDMLRSPQQKTRAAEKQGSARPGSVGTEGTLFAPKAQVPAPKRRKVRINSPSLIEVDAFGKQKIDMGFIAREFSSIGLPHSDPGDLRVYYRTNGRLRFRVTADPDSFLPYGMYPRLLGAWVATEACRTQNRTIHLGRNLSRFLEDTLHLKVTGGKNGTITHLKEQMWRFFNCEIAVLETIEEDGRLGKAIERMPLASKVKIWWHPKAGNQDSLFESSVLLGEEFFASILAHPVPIDWNTVNQLRRSSLALDLYFWVTYRMHTMRGIRVTVPLWGPGSLAQQVGSNYALVTAVDRKNFRYKIMDALAKVHSHYPAAKIEIEDASITLLKSDAHVTTAKLIR